MEIEELQEREADLREEIAQVKVICQGQGKSRFLEFELQRNKKLIEEHRRICEEIKKFFS